MVFFIIFVYACAGYDRTVARAHHSVSNSSAVWNGRNFATILLAVITGVYITLSICKALPVNRAKALSFSYASGHLFGGTLPLMNASLLSRNRYGLSEVIRDVRDKNDF